MNDKQPLNRYKPKRFVTTNQEPSDLVETSKPASHVLTEEEQIAQNFAQIRKKHDETKQANIKKKQELQRLNDEIAKLNKFVEATLAQKQKYSRKQEELKTRIADAQEELERERHDKRVYEHMLERISQKKLALESRSNNVQEILKSSRLMLDSQKEKSRVTKDIRHHSRIALNQLETSIELVRREKEDKLHELESSIQEQREFFRRKHFLVKRRAEIAEQAANEDRYKQEVHVKEKLMLNKLWYSLLSKKLKVFQQQTSEPREAFHTIKLHTGLNSIEEIVDKFITREDTYSLLNQSILKEEQRLAALEVEYSQALNQLKTAQALTSNTTKPDKELTSIDDRVEEAQKQMERAKETYVNTKKAYDQYGLILTELANRLQVSVDTRSFKDILADVVVKVDGLVAASA